MTQMAGFVVGFSVHSQDERGIALPQGPDLLRQSVEITFTPLLIILDDLSAFPLPL